MAKQGRPEKISAVDYDKIKQLLGGAAGGFWGTVSDRTVRNWIQVQPLWERLVEGHGSDVLEKYFTSRQRGKRAESVPSMTLLLPLSRLPTEIWVDVSKKIMSDLDDGLSHTQAAKRIKGHGFFAYADFRKHQTDAE